MLFYKLQKFNTVCIHLNFAVQATPDYIKWPAGQMYAHGCETPNWKESLEGLMLINSHKLESTIQHLSFTLCSKVHHKIKIKCLLSIFFSPLQIYKTYIFIGQRNVQYSLLPEYGWTNIFFSSKVPFKIHIHLQERFQIME